MWWFWYSGPTRPSTPAERLVLAWTVILVLVVSGIVCLWVGYHSSPAQAQQAAQLRVDGFICLAAAFAAWLAYRLFSWWIDQ